MAAMKIELAYGQTGLDVRLPNDARASIIRKPALSGDGEPGDLVRQALDQELRDSS